MAKLKFFPQETWMARVTAPRSQQMMVLLIDSNCTAIALEAAVGEDPLSNHAHHSLGTFDTYEEAEKACNDYARKWRAARAREKKCDCTEIQLPNGERVAAKFVDQTKPVAKQKAVKHNPKRAHSKSTRRATVREA